MIIVKKNFRQGYVKIKISLLDDLWYLSHIILPGDLITAKTERKIKIGDAKEGRTSVVRKTITLQLSVIGVSLDDGGVLRVKGTVTKGTDDVPLASHHSFGLSVHNEFSLEKKSWPKFLQEKLVDAANNTAQNILVVLFDRDSALFSKVTQQGIKHVAEINPEVQNKQYATNAAGSIIGDLIKELQSQLSHTEFSSIIIASPGFWHVPLKKALSADLKKKIIVLTAHGVDKGSVSKILARPELQSTLANQRLRQEQEVVDSFLSSLSKDLLAYGFDDVVTAAKSGAIQSLAITEKFLKESKEKNRYDSVDELLQSIDAAKGKVHLLYDASTTKIIDGLGGIAGILRWKI